MFTKELDDCAVLSQEYILIIDSAWPQSDFKFGFIHGINFTGFPLIV